MHLSDPRVMGKAQKTSKTSSSNYKLRKKQGRKVSSVVVFFSLIYFMSNLLFI